MKNKIQKLLAVCAMACAIISTLLPMYQLTKPFGECNSDGKWWFVCLTTAIALAFVNYIIEICSKN